MLLILGFDADFKGRADSLSLLVSSGSHHLSTTEQTLANNLACFLCS